MFDTMRDVRDLRVSLAELNGRLGLDLSPGKLAFVVKRLGMRDVRLEGDAIVYASFVPLETLISEAVLALARDGAELAACESCANWFDVEHDDGIFRDPAKLEGFLCRGCAEAMTAYRYYTEWLRT
jgi:hypothetical protein